MLCAKCGGKLTILVPLLICKTALSAVAVLVNDA